MFLITGDFFYAKCELFVLINCFSVLALWHNVMDNEDYSSSYCWLNIWSGARFELVMLNERWCKNITWAEDAIDVEN